MHQRYELQHAVKKIRTILLNNSGKDGGLEGLIVIDTIKRLCLDHYFQEEIRAILATHNSEWRPLDKEGGGGDLHEVALRFRLLRQEGYHITSEAFNKFKDETWKFKRELSKDTKGLMSLFEASHLAIQGEDILDEAREFSTQLLKTSLKNAEQLEATIIGSTLSHPYLRSLPRLTAQNFLHNFEVSLKFLHNLVDANGWTNEVWHLARMDFNMTQMTIQSEITEVYRWWNELNLMKELKLVRDQPIKWHIWSLAALPNSTMKEERIELTKAISFVYLIDDIFDVYGTLEELTLFTEAVRRWEYDNFEGLPNSMKMCVKALQDTTNDISHKIYTKHGWSCKTCLQNLWADLCNAFLVEAKWFSSGHMPSSDEYLKNGLVSSGTQLVAVLTFYLLGQGINSKSIEVLNSFPCIVSSVAKILRLSDDLGSAKDEHQEGYDGSFIDYYRNEHRGSSAESAQKHVSQLILEAWKCLNMACLSPAPFTTDFASAFFNLARLVPMMYSYDHNHRLPSLDKLMASLLYECVD
ncbi:hypothetical protein Cgig2_004270 [Carnegiea gigantea]|uniref:Uncharacterized protein n=1 Tax=Carnegiea gigantea TaxID=171969 RepID=A0A9Q1KHI8_9CARY|nr:hypothetical protein Cgig2_004270 [Carnegiea gigantea]